MYLFFWFFFFFSSRRRYTRCLSDWSSDVCSSDLKNVLRDLIGDKKKIVSMEDIQEAVSARFHVKIADLKSRRRSKTLVHPRQIAMYLCRELTDASYPEIGRHFGGKDHTTIIHACRQITKAKDSDTTLNAT